MISFTIPGQPVPKGRMKPNREPHYLLGDEEIGEQA